MSEKEEEWEVTVSLTFQELDVITQAIAFCLMLSPSKKIEDIAASIGTKMMDAAILQGSVDPEIMFELFPPQDEEDTDSSND